MRHSKAQIDARVAEVLQLRLLGALMPDLRKHAQEQGWAVSERTLFRYCNQADEQLAALVERDRNKNFAHHFAGRRNLFARCMAVSDYATALRVLQDEAQLLGLYP